MVFMEEDCSLCSHITSTNDEINLAKGKYSCSSSIAVPKLPLISIVLLFIVRCCVWCDRRTTLPHLFSVCNCHARFRCVGNVALARFCRCATFNQISTTLRKNTSSNISPIARLSSLSNISTTIYRQWDVNYPHLHLLQEY